MQSYHPPYEIERQGAEVPAECIGCPLLEDCSEAMIRASHSMIQLSYLNKTYSNSHEVMQEHIQDSSRATAGILEGFDTAFVYLARQSSELLDGFKDTYNRYGTMMLKFIDGCPSGIVRQKKGWIGHVVRCGYMVAQEQEQAQAD